MSNGVKIIVDIDNLINVSNEIIKKTDIYKATAAKIFEEINYMSNAWQGNDNLSYVDQINEFKDDFAQLDKLLRQYAKILKIADKEYTQALQDSYAIAKSI